VIFWTWEIQNFTFPNLQAHLKNSILTNVTQNNSVNTKRVGFIEQLTIIYI
jgi:hypothetical protein